MIKKNSEANNGPSWEVNKLWSLYGCHKRHFCHACQRRTCIIGGSGENVLACSRKQETREVLVSFYEDQKICQCHFQKDILPVLLAKGTKTRKFWHQGDNGKQRSFDQKPLVGRYPTLHNLTMAFRDPRGIGRSVSAVQAKTIHARFVANCSTVSCRAVFLFLCLTRPMELSQRMRVKK